MQKINLPPSLAAILFACPLHAVTIDDMAARNNKIIELDQEIAIAEKNKKLAELKGSYLQPEPILLPRLSPVHQEEPMTVIAVHGAPGNPTVDVQYGDELWQKRRGEMLPNGWEIADVGTHSVTFKKTQNSKRPPLIRKISIGRLGYPLADDGMAIPAGRE